MQPDEPLSESLCPMYGETFWWNFVIMEFLGVLGSSPFVLTITDMALVLSILGFLVAIFVLSPIVFLIAYFSARNRHRNSGFITSDGERVSVHHRFGGEFCFCSENLSESRWFRGSRTWATVPWSSNPFGPWFAGCTSCRKRRSIF